jgi:hypothetical protein
MGTKAAASQTRMPRSIVQQKICILLAVPAARKWTRLFQK